MDKGKGKAASSDQSQIGYKGVWDHENAGLPLGYPLDNLRESIDWALKRFDPRCYLEELIAFGPKKPPGIESHGITFYEIEKDNVSCQGDPKSRACYKYVTSYLKKKTEKKKRTTDIADVDIHIEMLTDILMGNNHLLLIAGDGDFLDIMEQFPLTKFLVAVGDEFDDRLLNPPLAAWRWTTDDPRIEPMTKGGGPTHRNRKL